MAKLTVKPVGKGFQPLVNQLQALKNEKVEVGHFAEQGKHYSGFGMDELMAFHHNGGNPDGGHPVTERPLLNILFNRLYNLDDSAIKAAFTRWKKRPPSVESNAKLLDEIGKRLAKLERDLFGDPVLGITNNPTPLDLTGDLKKAVSHRDTLNKNIRK